MSETALARLVRARARGLRRSLGDQLREAREVAELSQRAVAAGARIDRSVLSRAETGDATLTVDALAAIATALGLEASVRLYPASGPRIRDHVQVRMVEALAVSLDPRWTLRLEVPVWRPVRGVVDLVLVEPKEAVVVSGEAHGEIRRVELQLRRAAEKTDALPSATGWPWMTRTPRVCRLLLLRNGVATREVAAAAPALLAAAYPGRTEEAIGALTGPVGVLPDAAIAWVDVRGSGSRLIAGPPRGIATGADRA